MNLKIDFSAIDIDTIQPIPQGLNYQQTKDFLMRQFGAFGLDQSRVLAMSPVAMAAL